MGDFMVRHIWEKLPGLWVGLPVLGACLVAVAVGNSIGPLAGVGAGIAIGLLAALVIEAPLRALATVAAKIAAGDRYAIVPKQPRGPLSELAEAAQSLRMAVVEADTLMVDQRRREAEARVHYAGRSFFTRRFRGAVDEVVNAFTAGSQRIGYTAADLAHRNRHMHVKVQPPPTPRARSSPASGGRPATSSPPRRRAIAPQQTSAVPMRRCGRAKRATALPWWRAG
jgi:HAMP domain-containing protein